MNKMRMRMKTCVIYHSIDLDGWMSAAIVKHWFTTVQSVYKNVEVLNFIGYNHGQPIPDLSEYNQIIMCDISFSKEEMLKLYERLNSNFIWIDHHISAIKDNVLFNLEKGGNYHIDYYGIRDIEFAACELTWQYFFPNEPMPEIVRLLGRYDCFGHKGTNEEQKILEFQYGARQKISNYEEAYEWLTMCLDHSEICNEIQNAGDEIYQYLCTEARQAYKNGFEIIFKPIKNKVFLGGTCNNSSWRNQLTPLLGIDYFNPVVDDWTPECQMEEYRQKEEECNIHLYIITKEMIGVFSIAEIIDSVHSNKETIFVINPDGFDDKQLKSLKAVLDMVLKHGGKGEITNNMNNVALLLNRLESNFINRNLKFICINKERFNPINFGIDYHKDGYDGCACFHYADGVWNFSLYNDNGEVDCSSIAKQYGGGGHKGAAGFRISDIREILGNV